MTSNGNLVLNATLREITGRKVANLRAQGLIPAVLYGHNFDNKNLSVNYKEFVHIYDQAGESTLVDLKVDNGEEFKVLIQDVQLHPVTDKIIHVDLRAVSLDEKIEAYIPLKFVGISPAVKELGGTLVTPLEEIQVKALPQSLVHEIEVDISVLTDFNSAIHIRDLQIPEGIEVLDDEDLAVAIVEAPAQEEIEEEVSPEDAEKAAIKSQEQAGEGADKKEEEKKE